MTLEIQLMLCIMKGLQPQPKHPCLQHHNQQSTCIGVVTAYTCKIQKTLNVR